MQIALILMVAISILAVFTANPDSFVRDWLCTRDICWSSEAGAFWNALLYDSGMGVLISVVFYWLLVKVPEISKRRRLRRHLQASYKSFRREATTQLLFAANKNGAVNYNDIVAYSPMSEFRTYFKSASTDVVGNRWHDVANGMTDRIRKDLAVALALLRDDVSYILNVADIADDKSFELLHGLQRAANAVLLDQAQDEQDASLLGFLWQLMAGWDWLEGYPKDPKEDRVQRLIDKI